MSDKRKITCVCDVEFTQPGGCAPGPAQPDEAAKSGNAVAAGANLRSVSLGKKISAVEGQIGAREPDL